MKDFQQAQGVSLGGEEAPESAVETTETLVSLLDVRGFRKDHHKPQPKTTTTKEKK